MSEKAATTVDTPLSEVLGERPAKALATHLDLHTAGDLIYHFPRRYDERGEHTDMRKLEVGEQVTLLAQVQSTTTRPMRARKGNMLEITIGEALRRTVERFGDREALVVREQSYRATFTGSSSTSSP